MSEHIGYAIRREDGNLESQTRLTRSEADDLLTALMTIYPKSLKGARIVEIHELGADELRQVEFERELGKGPIPQ